MLRDVVAAQIRRDPEAPAIEFAGRWIAWSALDALRDRMDATIAGAGLRQATPIALVARNQPAHVGLVVGAMASGRPVTMIHAAQAPTAMATDVARLRPAILAAAAADWSAELVAVAHRHGAMGLVLDGMELCLQPGLERPGAGPHHQVAPDIAFELLSSGTTGAPKRTALKVQTVEQSALDGRAVYAAGGLAPAAQPPQIVIHPLANISGITFTIPLAYDGQRMVLLERFTLEGWLDAVRRHRPARCSIPVPGLRMLLAARVPKEDLASLVTLGVGGSALPPELQEEFEQVYGIPLLTAYGATEFCGVIASWTLDLNRACGARKRGSVGQARPGVELRVVDPETGIVLPQGSTGLLQARVARLGPDWIGTTDLAQIDAAGFLFLHGRSDEAINRGGFKIIPEAVAAVLRTHPRVLDAAVIARADMRLGQVPVAAVEPRDVDDPPDEAELLAHARGALMAWQVPARILVLPHLPRTASMKVSLPELRRVFEEAPRQAAGLAPSPIAVPS